MRSVKTVYIDAERCIRTDENGSTNISPLIFYRESQFIIRAYLRFRDLSVFPVSESDSFYWGFDNSYDTSIPDIGYTMNDNFNVAGDWTFDAANGHISWRVDMGTDSVATWLDSAVSKNALSELWVISNGRPSILGRFYITVRNVSVEPDMYV